MRIPHKHSTESLGAIERRRARKTKAVFDDRKVVQLNDEPATRTQLVMALAGVMPNKFQACGTLSKHTRGIHDFRTSRVPESINAATAQIIAQLSVPARTKGAGRRAA